MFKSTIVQNAYNAIQMQMHMLEDDIGEQTIVSTAQTTKTIDDLYTAMCTLQHNVSNLLSTYVHDIGYSEEMLYNVTVAYLNNICDERNAHIINTLKMHLALAYADDIKTHCTIIA